MFRTRSVEAVRLGDRRGAATDSARHRPLPRPRPEEAAGRRRHPLHPEHDHAANEAVEHNEENRVVDRRSDTARISWRVTPAAIETAYSGHRPHYYQTRSPTTGNAFSARRRIRRSWPRRSCGVAARRLAGGGREPPAGESRTTGHRFRPTHNDVIGNEVETEAPGKARGEFPKAPVSSPAVRRGPFIIACATRRS